MKPIYENLLKLIADKDYFVITTNVDHMFQKAGFDKKRLFYTQGDYGLFQNKCPTVRKTWDNEDWVMQAMAAQGFVKNEKDEFVIPEAGKITMHIPSELIPRNPEHGKAVIPNLRVDDSFVEDDGWHHASASYADFLRKHRGMHDSIDEISNRCGFSSPNYFSMVFKKYMGQTPAAYRKNKGSNKHEAYR